jgi:hypothetical protein
MKKSIISEEKIKKFDDVHIKSMNLTGMVYAIKGNDVVVNTVRKGLVKAKLDDLKKIYTESVNENFAKFDTLKMAVNQHEKGAPYYDKIRLINIFNQLSSSDQIKAKKQYRGYFGESVNEDFKAVVGKTVFSDGKGKLHFGYYKEDDSAYFVDYKTWAKLGMKDVSKGDTNKDRVVNSILRNQKQFNKKVDYNMWAKKTNPSFEEKMDWFIKNGWISNITKAGIKEGVESVNEGAMSDIDIIAKEAKDFKDFVKQFYAEYTNFPKNKESLKWLEDIYKGRTKMEGLERVATALPQTEEEPVNEGDEKSPEEILRGLREMAMGDLERIEDYAEMISDRMKEGQELSSWMYSQITLAVDQLNSVHDAMDGNDGVKESVNEAKNYKKGDKLKIKLPNGKKFDVVFVDYSGTKGIAYGKFKDGGEVSTKPFSLSSIVESVDEHKDCGCGCNGVTEGGCNTSLKEEKLNEWRAEEVLQQLGGRKFIAMTGAKNFVKNDKDKSITFKIPRAKDGITHVMITLNASDTYTINFLSIRGNNIKQKPVKGVYNDQLQSVFTQYTGLNTSL